MPIINPTQLVDEFKKSGEFDRLRRELLAQFRNGEDFASFMSRVEDIIQKKLASDGRLLSMSETSVSRELIQELNRYPIVERAVAEAPSLNNPAFMEGIRQSVGKILREDREGVHASNATDVLDATAKPALTVETQQPEMHGSGRTPAKEEDPEATPSVQVQAEESQSGAPDGNESDDSAMLESPLSDNNPSEADAPTTL